MYCQFRILIFCFGFLKSIKQLQNVLGILNSFEYNSNFLKTLSTITYSARTDSIVEIQQLTLVLSKLNRKTAERVNKKQRLEELAVHHQCIISG